MFKFLTPLISVFFSLAVSAQVGRNVSVYNLDSGLGLKGYDPLAVFPEGGGKATRGSPEFRLVYSGVTYNFSSEANSKLFETNPEKYEPTYGGWCAFAMASGQYVDIQPQLFTIHGRRAHYFVASRAKANFDRQIAEFETNADMHWKRISGEAPRK